MNIKNVLGIGFFLSLSFFSLYSMYESLQEKQEQFMDNIYGNNLNIVRVLLNEGLNPDFYWGSSHITPLMAAVSDNNYDIVQVLLAYEADPNLARKIDSRPFYEAALRNNIPIMKLLIQNKADWKIHYNAIVYGTGKYITETTKKWLEEYATEQEELKNQ